MQTQSNNPEPSHQMEHGSENDSDRTSLTITVAAAAALAGVAPCTFYEGIRRGELPSIRIGRRLLVPRRALERMLSGEPGPK